MNFSFRAARVQKTRVIFLMVKSFYIWLRMSHSQMPVLHLSIRKGTRKQQKGKVCCCTTGGQFVTTDLPITQLTLSARKWDIS